MKGTCRYFLSVPLCWLLFLPLMAQTTEKPLTGMTWLELTEKWEALAILGKNEEALPYARAALEMARRDSSEASLEYGGSLDCLGYSLHHSGHYAEAEQVFIAAVAHARKYLSESHEDYITRLSNLAMLHMDMGELARSASELETVVRLAERHLDSDNPYLGIMINNLGLAYELIGNLNRALEYYLRALDLTEKTVGTETARYAIRLNNIAAIYRKTGKPRQALEFSQKALAIFEKTVGKNHMDYLSGLNGLMGSYTVLARYDEALRISEELLALINEKSNKETAEVYNFIASVQNVYFLAGQYQRCADFGRQALSKYSEVFPRQYLRHAFVAQLIMSSLEKLGRIPEAVQYGILQNRYSLNELRENFKKFSEDEQLQFYHTYSQSGDHKELLFFARHPEFPELAGAAFDYQMTVKGLSMANHWQLFQSLHENSSAPLTAQFEELQQLQTSISRQYALPLARRQNNLDSLLARANELERNLALGSEPFRLLKQNTRWQDVQAALAPGEAAVEFGQLKKLGTDTILYVAWVVRPGDEWPRQVFLFEEKETGNLAATRRLYGLTPDAGGKNLHELLWNPLEPLLKGVTTLFFAPAGVLHQINLGAIPVSVSEVLADRVKLHRLVSTRQIIALKKAKSPTTPESALVFGGIRYETDSLALVSTNLVVSDQPSPEYYSQNRGASFGDDWDFLAGSLKEADVVRERLESAGAKVIFADGFQASEGFFKRAVQHSPTPTVLHLATHGFFLVAPDTNARSGFAAAENPMARAGLVLSGANRVWSGADPLTGQEDGILTALEISRLDLSGTELAVLSACGTGQGKVEAGEGVLGLQRAFKMAGVRYVIMTLWNVQDHDAYQFMDFFYAAWLTRKNTIPEAFREAQKKMRLLHSKPFQPAAWAGFVLLE